MTIQTPVTLGSSISGATIQSSWTLTTTNAIPTGSLVIVCVQAIFSSAQTITSVSDGTNTYTAAVTNAWEVGTQLVDAIYYKENAAAVSSGATITANFSGPTIAQPSIINAGYVLGTLASSSLDKTNSGITTAGTAYASGTTGTLSNANEIAFGFVGCYNANASFTEGAGFTPINTTSEGLGGFFQSRFSFDIVSATTALNYQPSTNLPTFGKALIATFIAAPVIPGSNQAGPIVPNRVRASPPDQSVGLNPNLFKNNFPNNQYDWPAPHRIRRSPYDLSVYLNPDIFGPAAPLPFNQVDWAKPVRLKGAFDYSVPLNPNLFTNVIPFNQVDWSKPVRVPQARLDPPYPLNINLQTNAFPNNQYDWNKPVRLKGAFDYSVPINPNIFTNNFPLNQYDWSKPVRVMQARLDPPYPLNINLFVNPLPFNQYDYNKPKRLPTAPFDLSVLLNINIFTNPLPFNQYDYNKQFRVPEARFDPAPPLNININSNNFPFNQFDYSKPFRIPKAPFDLSVPLSAAQIISLVSIPFNQFDYPLTRRRNSPPLTPFPLNLPIIVPPGITASTIIALDAAYGSSDVIRFYRSAVPSTATVGNPVAVLMDVGEPLDPKIPLAMNFTKPDGSVLIVPAYIGKPAGFTSKGIFEEVTYAVCVLSAAQVDQHGFWSAFLKTGVFASASQQFYIGPPPVLI